MSDNPLAKGWFDRTDGYSLKEATGVEIKGDQKFSDAPDQVNPDMLTGPEMRYDDATGTFVPAAQVVEERHPLEDAPPRIEDSISGVAPESMSAKQLLNHIEDCFDHLVVKLKKADARGAANLVSQARERISKVVRANG